MGFAGAGQLSRDLDVAADAGGWVLARHTERNP